MKFIDEAFIKIESGKGGNGCVSFRRERFIPKGGPDGGNGGKGGSIIFQSSSKINTLYKFRYQKYIKAENGKNGLSKQKTGKSGKDTIITLPVGTMLTDDTTKEILYDFNSDGDTFVAIEGGRGGLGNKHFATSRNRTPRFAQDGGESKILSIKLELKLVSDIGLIGLPNAGKSTTISAISKAKPKIADYPFTTIIPNMGVVQADWGEPFIVIDIPGLIKGASEGLGLGIKFLKHIERTKLLVHIIDASSLNEDDILSSYNTINNELKLYNEKLLDKVHLVVLNKIDMPNAEKLVKMFLKKSKLKNVLCISALKRIGIYELKSEMAQIIFRNQA